MASRKTELAKHNSKKKREREKVFTHQPENITGKKRIKIDEKTTVYINADQDENEFRKTYLETKALYEAANNTSRFGGKGKKKETD